MFRQRNSTKRAFASLGAELRVFSLWAEVYKALNLEAIALALINDDVKFYVGSGLYQSKKSRRVLIGGTVITRAMAAAGSERSERSRGTV
jgi:hypothetical protein